MAASSARRSFIVLRDVISGATPEYWEFWIGALLVVLVLVGRERIGEAPRRLIAVFAPRAARRGVGVSAPALEARGLARRFGGLIATDNVSFSVAARRAAGADRPQRRRQDDADQSADRRRSSRAQAQVLLQGARRHRRFRPAARVRRGPRAHVPDQSAVSRSDAGRVARPRDLRAQRLAAPISGASPATEPAIVAEIEDLLTRFGLERGAGPADAHAALRQAAPARDRARARLRARACCCSTSPPPACPRRSASDILAALAALPADVAILLIEHDMDLVFNFATRISVLVAGRLLCRGRRRTRSRRTSACARSISARTRMAELLRVEGLERRLRRGAGHPRPRASRSRTASRWRCSAATASARRR